MTTSPVLWFGMWDCGCTTIEVHVPARCPAHSVDLMAAPEPVLPVAGMPLGYESAATS